MEQMTREMRELKDIFTKVFNIGGEISQQPPLRATFIKPLRRISILFHSNETISEVLEAPTTTSFKPLRRISTLFPNNEAISEALKAPTTTSFKPLRRISTLFPSNEVISEASEVEDSVPRYQIPNPATSFKFLQRISISLPDNLFAFECLKVGGSADDSVPP